MHTNSLDLLKALDKDYFGGVYMRIRVTVVWLDVCNLSMADLSYHMILRRNACQWPPKCSNQHRRQCPWEKKFEKPWKTSKIEKYLMFSYVECNCYFSREFCSYNFLKFIGNGAALRLLTHFSQLSTILLVFLRFLKFAFKK